MAKALRHHYASRMAGKQPQVAREYEVVDPHARVDAKGEFAGVKARRVGGKLVVSLTDKQAKFYLTQGTIRRCPEPEESPRQKQRAPQKKAQAPAPKPADKPQQ